MPSRRYQFAVIRLATSLVIMELCIFVAPRGWSTAHFAMVRSKDAGTGADSDAIRPWIGTSGITAAAIRASLTQMTDPADLDGAARQADEFAALLSVRPLSSRTWLSLAEMRLVTGQPKAEVLDALNMSRLTGPNEGALMYQRGVFGLLIWDFLSLEERKLTVEQIARAMVETPIGDNDLASARNALSQQSTQARAEIAGLMRAESEAQATRLGL